MAGYILEWDGVYDQIVWVPTIGVRQGCKLGLVLFRMVVEDALQDIAADWAWGPFPYHSSSQCLGVELHGPNKNTLEQLHFLLFADDIFCIVASWVQAVPALKKFNTRLSGCQLKLAPAKTTVLCTSGPLYLLAQQDWPAQAIGGPTDAMDVLGAIFTLKQGFQACLPQRSTRCTRTWYMHKQLLSNNATQLPHRFHTASSLCQSSLFWGLIAAPMHAMVEGKLNTNALQIGRLTANLRKQGIPIDEYNKSSADYLRNHLSVDSTLWSKQFLKLQGQLFGHCLRQPEEFPECAVNLWRNREWCGFNNLLPPKVRVLQHDQGHIDAVVTWWSRHTPISQSIQSLASNRTKWREIVSCVVSVQSESMVAQASSTREPPVEL
eukprot:4976626-Amphidinium_carterae.1